MTAEEFHPIYIDRLIKEQGEEYEFFFTEFAEAYHQSKINISDEEIEKQATNYIDSHYSQCTEEDRHVIALGFEKGAKGLRNHILNKQP